MKECNKREILRNAVSKNNYESYFTIKQLIFTMELTHNCSICHKGNNFSSDNQMYKVLWIPEFIETNMIYVEKYILVNFVFYPTL
jgi:hypothetical protein